jgi:hypothetical protein
MPWDVRNMIHKLKPSALEDAALLVQELERMRDTEGLFFRLQLRGNSLSHVFWSSARQQKALWAWGDVISVDSTFGVNRFHLPFIVAVGVDSSLDTCVLASALVEDETVATYTWFFSLLKELKTGMEPTAIFTDGDHAMPLAIESVFPSTKHFLCAFHLMRSVRKHLGPMRNGEAIFKEWNELRKSSCEGAFDLRWSTFREKYSQCGEGLRLYFEDLHRMRRKWTRFSIRSCLSLGMNSTQRSEAFNAMAKSTLCTSTPLRGFVLSLETSVGMRAARKEKWRALQGELMRAGECFGSHPLLQSATDGLSPTLSDSVAHEFAMSGGFNAQKDDEEGCYVVVKHADPEHGGHIVTMTDEKCSCSCRMPTFMGIPCRHVFAALFLEQAKSLIASFVAPRWRLCAGEKMDAAYGSRFGERAMPPHAEETITVYASHEMEDSDSPGWVGTREEAEHRSASREDARRQGDARYADILALSREVASRSKHDLRKCAEIRRFLLAMLGDGEYRAREEGHEEDHDSSTQICNPRRPPGKQVSEKRAPDCVERKKRRRCAVCRNEGHNRRKCRAVRAGRNSEAQSATPDL